MLALHDEVSPESSCLTFGAHFFVSGIFSYISLTKVCRIGQIVQFCCFFWTNCPHLCHIKALYSMYCVHSSEWGLFGRNTRSAIQGTSSSPPREERADIGKDDVVEARKWIPNTPYIKYTRT